MGTVSIMCIRHFTFLFVVMFSFFGHRTSSESVQLVSKNIDEILKNNELVMVNFYADWCRFSQMLKPVYDSAAKKIEQEFPEEGKVAFGKVDCDKETGIAQQYHVSKYPTLKMFRQGQLIKREYRGQRSVEAISTYIREQLKDVIERVDSLEELDEIDKKKRNILGYFKDETSPDFDIYKRVASNLREDCVFYTATGTISEPERIAGNKIVFRPAGENVAEMVFAAGGINFDLLLQWTADKCVPLVREITFENAEELTEEGLPFMILFHAPDDTDTPARYRKSVAANLLPEKSNINFLTADGSKFTHPLYHLGKTIKDLPILCIDSFRHMYLWKQDVKADLEKPGLLKQFIADLHSGKLHREFHHGPDATTTESADAQNGGDAGLATIADGNGHDHNMVHMNVQQQVIVHSDGTRVQVVRLVQMGQQQPIDPIDFEKHMRALERIDNSKDEDEDEDEEDDDDADDKEIKGDPQVEDLEQKFRTVIETAPNTQQDRDDLGQQKVEGQGTADHRQVTVDLHQQLSREQAEDGTETTVFNKVSEIKVKTLLNDDEYESDKKQPPNSMFRKLAPSRDRYTLLKDEL